MSEPNDEQFWAKIRVNDVGEVEAWHSLSAHSVEVGAVTKSLLENSTLRDRLACLLGWDNLERGHIDRLAALGSLHDIGKVNHGFQNETDGYGAGHVRPLISTLDRSEILYEPLRLQNFLDWFQEVPAHETRDEALYRVLMATFAHHGKPVDPSTVTFFNSDLWEPEGPRHPLKKIADIRNKVESWFSSAFSGDVKPFPVTSEFQHAFNGILTLADWIASDENFFPLLNGDSYAKPPMNKAERAVHAIGASAEKFRSSLSASRPSFDEIAEFEPYEIQQACLELPTDSKGSLTILESDTGSGKTEAALARFLTLYKAGKVDGLYFALPTRSAATQLHGRVHEAVQKMFQDAEEAPPVVQAVPGYLKVGDHEGQPLPDFEVAWMDNPDSRQKRRRWAAEHSKRYLAGSIVVGTIDQVFLSTLKIKHTQLRAGALLRNLMVVDEVHASDPYMTRLLESVLDFHLEAGGHAFLMSATLGDSAKQQLLNKKERNQPNYKEAIGQSYPLLTYTTYESTDISESHHQSSDYSKTVSLNSEEEADDPEKVAGRALTYAQDGARVLVIRNLVDDCRDTQKALEKLSETKSELFSVNKTAVPHHSRFAPDDRRLMDEAVEETFGERSTGINGVVCVATQTVEQSLDIDADVLITDLAPVDVLLQRIGRLHRDETTLRPQGYEHARTTVLIPDEMKFEEWIESNGKAFGPHGYGTVYSDCRILLATLELVENKNEWTIPEMNRELVESATHPEKLRMIVKDRGEGWKQHQEELETARLVDRWKGEHWIVDRENDFFAETFPRKKDLDEQIKTRLGENQIQVELKDPIPSPLDGDNKIDELTISERYFENTEELSEDSSLADRNLGSDRLTFEFGGERFRYDRMGLYHLD